MAVHTGFIFLDLLEFNPHPIGELLLRHADHPPPVADPFAHMFINWMAHFLLSEFFPCTLQKYRSYTLEASRFKRIDPNLLSRMLIFRLHVISCFESRARMLKKGFIRLLGYP